MLLVDKVRVSYMYVWNGTANGERRAPYLPNSPDKFEIPVQYRPETLDAFETINASTAQTLKAVVRSGDCPHTLFYGPTGAGTYLSSISNVDLRVLTPPTPTHPQPPPTTPTHLVCPLVGPDAPRCLLGDVFVCNAGKKTLILAMLRELYGPAASKVHVEYKPWKITLPSGSTKEIEFATVSSAYHIEINPSDVGMNDRYVVQEIIKEMARSRPIGASGEKTYKMLILNEVDKLSKEAQAGLRRTMEKYASACRLVLCCSNVSKVIEPLRSRCLLVRVGAPQTAECVALLSRVSAEERLAVPDGLIARIVASSRRNMRRALLSMEALAVRAGGESLTDGMDVILPDWEMYVKEIAGDILREQTARNLFVVRGKLYELIVNCIPPEVILRTLAAELAGKIDDELKRQTFELAATYEWRLQQGQKAIFHLEAFVAKFMSVFKNYMVSLMG